MEILRRLIIHLRSLIYYKQRERDLADELVFHLEEEAADQMARGLPASQARLAARRSLGNVTLVRESTRDVWVWSWLHQAAKDFRFGWRQIRKSKVVSAAAILSLALAVGACTAAFRLIDALLLRPLPVASPEQLYLLSYDFKSDFLPKNAEPVHGDAFDYRSFEDLRAAGMGTAEVLAISYPNRIDLSYGSDRDIEKAYLQYVSGATFDALGLKPVLGRLLIPADDSAPGGHPYAVISYDYWQSRFGADPDVLSRTFRIANDVYQIVGVIDRGFTGTDPGTITDLFVPTMMNANAVRNPNWNWLRIWVQLRRGAEPEQLREKLRSAFVANRRERVKTWRNDTPQRDIDEYLRAPLYLDPAATGVSGMQRTYRRSIAILAVLVVLVLLIACANVANLLTAQAASRKREMALRVSIGAGRRRLVQLVLAESTIIAVAATAGGAFFASWAAPFVAGMINPPDNPARFVLASDARIFLFLAAIAAIVAVLFGLAPAFRASSVKPVDALKGGEDPHTRRRLMRALVAVQVAFCFLVHFVSGLFVSTFDRLSSQPIGFSPERVAVVEVASTELMPPAAWEQLTARLRALPGIESAAFSNFALMSNNSWMRPVWANGHGPEQIQNPHFLSISPGWFETMKIPLVDGRDFREGDTGPSAAIVNESFARAFFGGVNPLGRTIEISAGQNRRDAATIVGYVRDARYNSMRDEIPPTVYIPNRNRSANGELVAPDWGAIVVRSSVGDPLQLAPAIRQVVPELHAAFRVSTIRTQEELIRAKTIRERMLAMLSLFFAAVALLLAAIGLYGVLDYSVLQLRRDIGIRLALGAQRSKIVRRVTAEVFSMLIVGSGVGLLLGIASERYVKTLLYQVKGTDPWMLLIPALTILSASFLAALPPVLRALRIDPAGMLRAE